MYPNLLLVDDDEQMLEELSAIFKSNNIHPMPAASAGQCLEVAERHAFDAALLDIKLPGCTGLELVERLKVVQPNAAYIMMTAYASLESVIHALKQGVHDYVLKPFSPDDIVTAVKRGIQLRELALREQSRADALQLQNKIMDEKIAQLRKLNEIFLGRENLVRELKGEVNQLLRRLGEPAKYDGV